MVQRAVVDFLRPARLNDRLAVTVEVLDRGASRLVVAQRVTRAGEPIASGEVTLACVHAATLKPRRMPAALATALAALPTLPDNLQRGAS